MWRKDRGMGLGLLEFPKHPAWHQAFDPAQIAVGLGGVSRHKVIRFAERGHDANHAQLPVLPELVNHAIFFSDHYHVWPPAVGMRQDRGSRNEPSA